MKLDDVVPVEEDEDPATTEATPKKMPQRKTKAQRNKAAKILAQVCPRFFSQLRPPAEYNPRNAL
jgi:hypothetical protein